MTPNRKAAIFLIVVATVLLIVAVVAGMTQTANAGDCRISNGSAALMATIRHEPAPTPAPCGVRTVTWLVAAAGGLLAVIGATLFIAGGTPTSHTTYVPPQISDEERQFRRYI